MAWLKCQMTEILNCIVGAMRVRGPTWSRINVEQKYKARFVVKGYLQIPKVDYHGLG